MEALSEASSGLTYPALTGSRKQSVIDAERLFSPDLAAFMRGKVYVYEAKYIETVWNWRRACDERGLSELQRCKYNYQFLNLILDKLIPWHSETYDFSKLEVSRYYLQSYSTDQWKGKWQPWVFRGWDTMCPWAEMHGNVATATPTRGRAAGGPRQLYARK